MELDIDALQMVALAESGLEFSDEGDCKVTCAATCADTCFITG